MEQIASLWPGHGPTPSQQSFLSILVSLFSMAKIGGNTQACYSERRAGREKLFRGTLASLDHCPTVRRGNSQLFELQRDGPWRDASASHPAVCWLKGKVGSYPTHYCGLPASGLSNSPTCSCIKFSMGIHVLHFSFLSKYILIFSLRGERMKSNNFL